MVILITGATHTGKTALAQKMLEKYKYPYTSVDHLKMGLIRSGNTKLTPEDDGELTAYLWPIVREMIKTAVENRQDLIVEGCYVPFEWRRDFGEEYLREIRFICLAMTEKYIDAHYGEIIGHANEIEERIIDPGLSPGALKVANREIIDGFGRAGEQVELIDSDYARTVNELLDVPELGIEFKDNEWPYEFTDHDRRIARAIVYDDDGYFYFVRAVRDDYFGKATLIETSGGGIEANEDQLSAIRRELKEELGADVEVIRKICVVRDYYNLIHRRNLNNYFLCRVRSFGDKHLMPDEIEDFHLSTLRLTFDEAVREYELRRDSALGRLIAQRELPVLMKAKVLMNAKEHMNAL